MRQKILNDYLPASMGPLKFLLADIYSGLENASNKFYLVGGLVPVFLVNNKLTYLKEYLGTLDIDLAVELAVKPNLGFKDLYAKLCSLGFEKQKTDDGADLMAHSFIKHVSSQSSVVLDLIIDDRFEPKADKLKEISRNVEAVKFRGVYLVFADYLVKEIRNKAGITIKIRIPNIIPFLTLKLFVYSDPQNGSAKDAFDIWYTIVNFDNGPDAVSEELLKYRDNLDVKDAFIAIKNLFKRESSKGVRDVTRILTTRYGLSMPLANREVTAPFNRLLELNM